MIITKRPDGTVELSGFVFEILDYVAQALHIRKVFFLFILIYDFEKYGNRNSQVFAIKNDVIIFIFILRNEFVYLNI